MNSLNNIEQDIKSNDFFKPDPNTVRFTESFGGKVVFYMDPYDQNVLKVERNPKRKMGEKKKMKILNYKYVNDITFIESCQWVITNAN